MSKVTIIPIDLGEDIDSIISDDVAELTAKNREDVNLAIKEKKALQNAKTQKVEKIDQVAKAKVAALITVYQALLKVHQDNDGTISLDEMVKLSSPAIDNSSSLIIQLKAFIRKEYDNAYVLKKQKRNKKPIYGLIKFNAE
jgi:hypothetical protein